MATSAFLASRNATFCKAGALTRRCIVDQVHADVQSSRCWGALRQSGFKHSKRNKESPLKRQNPLFTELLRNPESRGERQQVGASTSYRSENISSCGCWQKERLGSRGQCVQTFATADTASGGADTQEAEHFTLTTPLYYANAAPHMGSAYPTFAADALARFQVSAMWSHEHHRNRLFRSLPAFWALALIHPIIKVAKGTGLCEVLDAHAVKRAPPPLQIKFWNFALTGPLISARVIL